MTELLTAAQMRAIEQVAIASGEVTGLELMERAGRGVVEAILEEWPEMALTSQKAVVLCGPGNNGGDGFVVARLLKQRGWGVEVFLYGEVAKLPPDAKVNAERWLEMGEVLRLTETGFRRAKDPDIIVDAIFGAGLSRPLEGEVWKLVSHLSGRNGDSYLSKLICIDAPSGLCLDSGRNLGVLNPFDHILSRGRPFARLTVSFDSPKIGHFIADGPKYSSKTKFVNIGLQQFRQVNILTRVVKLKKGKKKTVKGKIGKLIKVSLALNKPLVNDCRVNRLSLPDICNKGGHFKADTSHKYTHGHVLILSGPAHFTGASRLAARGALRIGAGLVTIGAEADALPEHAAQLTSIMLSELPDAEALREKLQDKRINALCLGPGLGVDDRARGLVSAGLAVRGDHAPYAVLDADALTLLAQNADLFGMLHENVVLTPHAGEFARLFPDIAAKLAEPAITGPAYSKVDATRDAAKRAGCVVLFKGADTVIADQTGRAAINSAHYERSAPWLATAGSGDVLAGFITGLLARGFAPMQAAETAAWLHVECALKFGPGLIAEDIPEQLPQVFRDLGL